MIDKNYIEIVSEVSEKIMLPEPVRQKLKEVLQKLPAENAKPFVAGLTGAKWEECRCMLKNILGEDDGGMKILACMLWAAGYSECKYREAKIPEYVFTETMKCFTRFVNEHKASYGSWGFDRDFWIGRQLSLQLFRLGELEYEKCIENKESKISIHIPSDADLSREKCRESLKLAVKFFSYEKEHRLPFNEDGELAADFSAAPYICESWLLSPALKILLPRTSKIIKFQEMFEICSVNEKDMSFMEWVYKRRDIPLEALPENTSLQRNMKRFLLSGGQIGEASGKLKKSYLARE
ncbi:MAG: DUF5596 domain-containing protein [Clostridiales bacterium]|nr:DUF5596 domain-containing protein [Clostridiales bacterium]